MPRKNVSEAPTWAKVEIRIKIPPTMTVLELQRLFRDVEDAACVAGARAVRLRAAEETT